jgi:hypothetical protein
LTWQHNKYILYEVWIEAEETVEDRAYDKPECVLCTAQGETEETVEHQAHNTTQHTEWQYSDEINAWFAIRINKQLTK